MGGGSGHFSGLGGPMVGLKLSTLLKVYVGLCLLGLLPVEP